MERKTFMKYVVSDVDSPIARVANIPKEVVDELCPTQEKIYIKLNESYFSIIFTEK